MIYILKETVEDGLAKNAKKNYIPRSKFREWLEIATIKAKLWTIMKKD